MILFLIFFLLFFFFNDTPTTEIYTLSLHDALPILAAGEVRDDLVGIHVAAGARAGLEDVDRELRVVPPFRNFQRRLDRKSTRLNSSHSQISYAVFCLKKKKKDKKI